jgi:uncharacterized protein (UPF0333 family)
LKGQLSIEALVSFLILLVVISIFLSAVGKLAERAEDAAFHTQARAGLEEVRMRINLLSTNGKNSDMGFYLVNVTGKGHLLIYGDGNKSVSARVIPNVYGRTIRKTNLQPI